MKLLLGNVLIKPTTPETKTTSGIVMSSAQEEQVATGTVVAVGSGSIASTGIAVPIEASPKDTIMYKTRNQIKIQHEGEVHVIVDQRDLVMIV